MKTVLDRKFLNPELLWHSGTLDDVQVHTRNDIDRCINQWKHVLEHQHGHGRGRQILLNFEIRDINWLAVTVANWELGGKQTAFHPSYPDLWAPWHVIVSDSASAESLKPHALHYLSGKLDHDSHVAANTEAVCQPTDSVLGFNSSGSTGIPTKGNHSHEFMYALGQRNISALGLNQPGLESALLVHGGAHNVVLAHLLPVLAQFEHVHSLPFVADRMAELAQYVSDHKINVIMLPHPLSIELFLTHAPRFNHTVKIFQLLANQANWIKLIQEKNVQSIRTSYGAMEVFTPVLANEITQQTDDSYSPMNFGQPLDNFYTIELTDQNNLRVSHPLLEVKSHVIPDYFIQDHAGNLLYGNRDKTIRLQGQDVLWNVIEQCVHVHGNPSLMCIIAVSDRVCLLVDQRYSQDQVNQLASKINADLAKIADGVCLDHVSLVDITTFINSHKFNLSQVKRYFIDKFNLARGSDE
jgi:hypothetical protein